MLRVLHKTRLLGGKRLSRANECHTRGGREHGKCCRCAHYGRAEMKNKELEQRSIKLEWRAEESGVITGVEV